jgi:ATP-dependent exoDNAse (exonuclease V) beta subunit
MNLQTKIKINNIIHTIELKIKYHEKRSVYIIDYKTDTDKDAFRQKYVAQVQEYMAIIKKIYPKYNVSGHILWLHDWTLESV